MRTLLVLLVLLFSSALISSCVVVREADSDSDYYNYVPPPWAPPYDQISTIEYYYLPDYEIYYDVWHRQFWYFNGVVWVATIGIPPCCPDVDLFTVFIVLIHHDEVHPWQRHQWYHDNYPWHCYDHYRQIVRDHRVIRGDVPERPIVPRAFNENNDRVTFMERDDNASQIDQHASQPPIPQPSQPTRPIQPPPQPAPSRPSSNASREHANYGNVTHEVPMRVISPAMPAQSRPYNYGGGYRPSQPAQNQQPSGKPSSKPSTNPPSSEKPSGTPPSK